MNPISLIYQNEPERTAVKPIKGGGRGIGRAVESKTNGVTFRFGCLNTQTLKWLVIFTNIDLLCQSILGDHLKAQSLFTTEMGLEMITELEIWNYLHTTCIGAKLNVHIAERNLR